MKLFDPISIRGMKIKNRVVSAAMAIGVTNLGVEPETEKIISYYDDIAAGGAGTVIIGALSSAFIIADEKLGQAIPPEKYIDALARVVKAVQRHGARFGVQLMGTNQYPLGANNPEAKSQEWVAPSDTTKDTIHLWYIPQDRLRALTIPEINAVIGRYAKAAAVVKKTGADFVELHMAHGHLVNQFFSPVVNTRQDKYGGSLRARMTFGLETVRAMRAAVGEKYPIFVRLGMVDEREGGITLKDSIAYASELEKAGVDCFDVSVGVSVKQKYDNYVSPLKKMPAATFLAYAEAVKRVVKVPVITAGRVHNPDLAESIVASGKADFVALARQLLCDPAWPQKVQEGRLEDIVTCSSCNTWCGGRVDLLYQDYKDTVQGCSMKRRSEAP
jgi:2,4-dienoyl-CoA reductase (NADPH2)